MKLVTPNLDRQNRVMYVLLGVVLMSTAWLAPFSSRAVRLAVGVLGLISAGEGLVGF